MLANRVVLVTGVANAKSIAWSVSKVGKEALVER